MGMTLADWLRRKIEPLQYRLFLIPRAVIMQQRRIRQIRKKGRAKVVFLVSSLPMWKFQPLFDILQKDSRFDVAIAICPFPYSREKQNKDNKELLSFFSGKDINIINLFGEAKPGSVLREKMDPDIIFYPQPYLHLYWSDLDCQYFYDKLICYIPYAALTSREIWAYKTMLNDVAWRLFYPSELQKQEASEVLYNKGRNIRVTGEFIADLFRSPEMENAWKAQTSQKKRIIWAPHYSMLEGDLLHRDSFLWLHQTMLDLAERYKDRIQFSFKPHPRLIQSLYDMPDWGKQKTDAYFRNWQDGENTQLDTGPYIDLFIQSDAMIHDSSSFSVEYHYTGKPVLFTSRNLESELDHLNAFGREAVLAQYICDTKEGIIDFIEKNVLGESDPRKPDRDLFYSKYLHPPGGFRVSENIYQEILTGLGLG